ncbi:MAG: hypothetical protein M3335_05310 [Actinomycetota bacterium]|nr:hypothetical protein [Actinomycetota bacterium]
MDASLVISGLGLCVGIAALLWRLHTWRAARRTNVQVKVWHDTGSLDIFPDKEIVEHIIDLQVLNNGEQPEYVVTTGLKSTSGGRLVDDRPTAPKMVDAPPPVPREIPPRGQLAVKFKVPAPGTVEGFVGYADLATGRRVLSMPAKADAGIVGIQAEVMKVVAEYQSRQPSSDSTSGS